MNFFTDHAEYVRIAIATSGLIKPIREMLKYLAH